MRIGRFLVAALVMTLTGAPAVSHAFSIIQGIGAAGTQTAVADFRTAVGDPNNGNDPGPLSSGRREINWDGGGNPNGSPGVTPFEVFQNRGVIFTTPGSGFQQAPISTGTGNLSDVFGVDYSTTFQTFSPVRLFVPVGSTETVGVFSAAGTNGLIPGGTSAFGAVFTDVDLADSTTIELFGLSGDLLASVHVPAAPGNGELSFLGIILDPSDELAHRVRITTGTNALGVADNPGQGIDVVAMDDFIFAEPQVVPEPSALLLVGVGLLALGVAARTRRCGAGYSTR
ncbi:MAG TPA: PEP-CTERM sorting domain-containing protein [Methylomirabilota bacterium]|nr:PEP-CTERM sorting domain-containing protein [Methylomirabilota bacterium]